MTLDTLAGQRTHTVVDSPVGPLTLVAAGGTLAGLYMDDQRHRPADVGAPGDAAVLIDTAAQLTEYFAGERTDFVLPLAMLGTDFQRRVWAALCDIPFGETISYGQLAERIGQPTASRAVGLANGRNPISIVVPCHRVIGSTGRMTGYGGGIARKQQLLDAERAAAWKA